MRLLRVESTRKPHKLIGVSARTDTHEYITLYSLAKGTTKSKIFRMLLEDWMRHQRGVETDDMLLDELLQRVNIRREEEKIRGKFTTDISFKESIRTELKLKGLKEIYVEWVLKHM